MSEPVTAEGLVRKATHAIATRKTHECINWTEAGCVVLDGVCDCAADARAAIAAVAEAADIGARQLRSTAEYLALVGTADDRRVAALLRALAEAVDA